MSTVHAMRVPKAGANNIWYRITSGETVIIFVHGIFSDSKSCWLDEAEVGKAHQYWPHIVSTDKRFYDASIFLGGFYTAFDAREFDLSQASEHFFDALSRKIEPSERPVLSRKNLLFICHSTGGIVTRHMLCHHIDSFRRKNIGLLLIASPSIGSRLANWLDVVAKLYNNKLASQLKWNESQLTELDAHFKDVIRSELLSNLVGKEAVENHFVIHYKWAPLFTKQLVVDPESGARYFGAATVLPETNHMSCVKPDSERHPSHVLLADFYDHDFRPLIKRSSQERFRQLVFDISALNSGQGSLVIEHVLKTSKEAYLRAVREIETIEEINLCPMYALLRAEYCAYLYALLGSVENSSDQAHEYKERAKDFSFRAFHLIDLAVGRAARGEPHWTELGRLVGDTNRKDKIMAILNGKLGSKLPWNDLLPSQCESEPVCIK